MVPQYCSYGSAGMPAVPATIFMSARDTSLGYFGALYNVNIFLEGTFGKIILTRYSIVIEHQIKLLAKIFSTKGGSDNPNITLPKRLIKIVWQLSNSFYLFAVFQTRSKTIFIS